MDLKANIVDTHTEHQEKHEAKDIKTDSPQPTEPVPRARIGSEFI